MSINSELLIKGGLIVTAEKQMISDILIKNGRIYKTGPGIVPSEQIKTINAEGLQILPGGIDPHAHLIPPFVDDYLSGSMAALAGGITTIGSMVYGNDNDSLNVILKKQNKMVKEKALADIFFHPYIENLSPDLEAVCKEGQRSIKIFLLSKNYTNNKKTYKNIIKKAGELGLITLLHCEDAYLLDKACRELEAKKRTGLKYYAQSRPVEAEASAVQEAVQIAGETGASIYIVHLSSKRALDICLQAKKDGLKLYIETRPIYLYFTQKCYQTEKGPLYVGQPPLRDEEDKVALWNAIISGDIDTIASDHAPWTEKQKMDPDLHIRDLRPGVADLQTMLPVFYSQAVLSKKISLEQFVALTSANSAKIFGFYPKKGTIEVGSDADLAIWDPNEKRTIIKKDMFSASDFSLHEGWEIQGWPVMTIRRGEIVYKNKQLFGLPGSGRTHGVSSLVFSRLS